MKFLKRILPIIVAFAAMLPAKADILGVDSLDAVSVGVYIKDLRNGEVLVDYNSPLALTPASVTKAVTTAAALMQLGTDYRFVTPVSLSGSRSASVRSSWNGNIVIDACADPTLESPEFKKYQGFADSIVAHIKQMGITKISGKIVVKQTLKDAGPVPTWECEDLAWPYGAGLFGFNYAGNVVKVYPARGTTVPPSDLKVTCITSDSNDLMRGICSNELVVWATAANLRKRGFFLETTLNDPASMFVGLLTSKLAEAGITISGRESSATGSTQLYTHRSPSASEICNDLMKRSDNLFAEGVLRALRPGGTRKAALKAEADFFNSVGLDMSRTIILDGSGLTRTNRLSPLFLCEMFEYMISTPVFGDYLAGFPVAGVDGTLKNFLAKTPLQGCFALKTGSMRSVSAYAGYKLDADGRPTHVVAIMVNGFFGSSSQVREKIEQFLLTTFQN